MENHFRNAHSWLVDSLNDEPSYLQKRMFGCLACYLHGLLVLVLCDKQTPWNGILLATERVHHASLQAQFPALCPHPVLGKWLFLSADSERFEFHAQALLRLVLGGDTRVGVTPTGIRNKKGKKVKKTRATTVAKRSKRKA